MIMEKYYEVVSGERFPVRVVPVPEEWGFGSPINVADDRLAMALEEAGNDETDKQILNDLEKIDNKICFYCNYGFIASDPTDEEIVEYLKKNLS